jgi:hypothetical protein
MNSTSRTSVFLSDGRLYPVEIQRPAGRGPWPRVTQFNDAELVLTVEGPNGKQEVHQGPAFTPELLSDAFYLAQGIAPANISPEVWQRVPADLRRRIENRIHEVERNVIGQLPWFSNEEAVTGAFFSQLASPLFEAEGWRTRISFVEFSKQVKEPLTGTDVAIIVDALASNGMRSFKTIWFQAKSLSSMPNAQTSPPRMREQLRRAQGYCDSSYGLAYTPSGIFVLGPPGVEPEAIEQTLDRCMQCQVGDFSVGALMNSMNRKHLVQINITEGPIPGRRRMRIGRQ